MLSPIEYPIIWIIILSAALVALFGLSRLVSLTANNLTGHEKGFSSQLNIALIIWPLLAVAYALVVGLSFNTFLPMLAVPLLLGTVLLFQPHVTNILKNIPLHLLILLGFYRVAGYVFLHAYEQHDLLSYGFAFNAGWGDVLTGVLAPIVAYLVYKRMSGSFVIVLIWTFIGIGDLILASVSASLYGAERLVDFPMNLVPLFLGPPFGILLHLITLRALWVQRDALSADTPQLTTQQQ